MTNDDMRDLWGVDKDQLLLFIPELIDLSEKQANGLEKLPYDALEALLYKLDGANDMAAKCWGDTMDPVKIAILKRTKQRILDSYLSCSYVTATLDTGEVMRGRLTPAGSGQRGIIDYAGNKWGLSKFIGLDPPLDGEGG